MQQQDKRYYELAEKWLNGTITEEERKEFDQWYNTGQDEEINVPAEFAISEEALHKRLLEKIHAKKTKAPKIRSLAGTTFFRVAAAAILFLFCGSLVYYLNQEVPGSNKPENAVVKVKQKEVVPGGNKAVLILGDGSEIILDSASEGAIAQQQNIKIIKLNNGQLTYKTLQGKASRAVYNTLTTPKGGQYTITLSDGTRVWLNAASSLRFPAAFVGRHRVVELTGEGYFEVAKDPSMPFKVKAKGMEVEVLGTHFNINAYADENTVNTTLLEGSVKVAKGNENKKIKPGQQAIIRDNGDLSIVNNINIEEVIAWKNNEFRFEHIKVSKIMRQVARWYDVEIEYEKNVPDVELSGIISRKEEVSQLLEILEATHKIQFQLSGNKIMVLPYNKKTSTHFYN